MVVSSFPLHCFVQAVLFEQPLGRFYDLLLQGALALQVSEMRVLQEKHTMPTQLEGRLQRKHGDLLKELLCQPKIVTFRFGFMLFAVLEEETGSNLNLKCFTQRIMFV